MRKSRQTKEFDGVKVNVATWPQEKANRKRNTRKKTSRDMLRKQKPQA